MKNAEWGSQHPISQNKTQRYQNGLHGCSFLRYQIHCRIMLPTDSQHGFVLIIRDNVSGEFTVAIQISTVLKLSCLAVIVSTVKVTS